MDELKALVESIDPRGTVTRSQHDGGYTLRVYIPGHGTFAAHYEWGDEELGVADPIAVLIRDIRQAVAV